MTRNWFMNAVNDKPPYNLGGWKKSLSEVTRRRKALGSRPKSWSLYRRYLSAARALQALANVTRDNATKMKAKADARYFYDKAKKAKRR